MVVLRVLDQGQTFPSEQRSMLLDLLVSFGQVKYLQRQRAKHLDYG